MEDVVLIPYSVMYRLGIAPWERRDIAGAWEPILSVEGAPKPGRALDIGCGRGRDAVYLSKRGWQVTAVDRVIDALTKARERAAAEGVQVQWIQSDIAELGSLGLKPGYTLLYDFGCIQGIPDSARKKAAAAMTALAAPGALMILFAFQSGRRLILPRGMEREDVLALFGDGWSLDSAEPAVDEGMPRPVRRAGPTSYRLTRRA